MALRERSRVNPWRGRLAALVLLSLPATALAGPEPRMPGFVAPWNRPARDSVVDLAPAEPGDRIEISGRLLAADGVSPLAGARVFVHHADSRGYYADPSTPDLDRLAGVFRSGPGGGFIVRSTVPGMYEGPPHLHFDAVLPGRKRCTTFVNLYPDSASWPLPGTMNQPWMRAARTEKQAVFHRDADGVYRTTLVLHTRSWYEQAELDSIRAAIARKYERAPWRGKGK